MQEFICVRQANSVFRLIDTMLFVIIHNSAKTLSHY